MLQITDISPDEYGGQNDRKSWPRQRELLESVFSSKTRDEWAELFDGTDACVTPVLDLAEAQDHPHNKARNSHTKVGGMSHPHPAPRFDSVNPVCPTAIPQKGADTASLLQSIGCSPETIKSLT